MDTEKQALGQLPPYEEHKQTGGCPQPIGYQPLSTGQQTTAYSQPTGYEPVPTGEQTPADQQPTGHQPLSTGQQTTSCPQPTGYQPVSTGQQVPGYPQTTVYQPYGSPGQIPYGQPGHEQSHFVQPPIAPVTTQHVILLQPRHPQQAVVNAVPRQSKPQDCLVPAIFACLCCFWPTGICAIYYASRTSQLFARGNTAEAQRASRKARNLVITTIVIGINCIIVTIVLRVVLANRYRSYSNR